jgi:D-ribose pyranase
MTETGVLNRELAAELSRMGHGDKLLIADAGLALPNTTKVVDLSLDVNVPTALEVLKVLLRHFSVEKAILSRATHETSPTRAKDFLACFEKGVVSEAVEHNVLRDELTREVKFAIRTGDFTAYSNIVLVSAGGPRWFCER